VKEQEESKDTNLANPQDTKIVSRALQGDPDDPVIIKAMENIKGYRDFRMTGTYVIRKLSEEAAIAELLIKSIKHNLENKIYAKKN
jgi:hypothetical protein